MNRLSYALFALATLGMGGLYGWVRFRSEFDPATFQAPSVDEDIHRVTDRMAETAAAVANTPAPGLRAPASDGSSYDLAELTAERPVFLVFIKDGCPCSEDASPLYERLFRAYGERVRFLGVINGDVEVARSWAAANRVSYPILADPELAIIHAYEAGNSAYTALVDRSGTLEVLWPGYSKGMLREASERVARLAGVEPVPVDTTGAPEQMLTGCPFF